MHLKLVASTLPCSTLGVLYQLSNKRVKDHSMAPYKVSDTGLGVQWTKMWTTHSKSVASSCLVWCGAVCAHTLAEVGDEPLALSLASFWFIHHSLLASSSNTGGYCHTQPAVRVLLLGAKS